VKIARLLTVAALAVTPVLCVTAPAVAHGGSHPFENCSAAEAAGYSNIPRGDEHYAPKLDRDKDGWGCDKHGTLANDGRQKTGYFAEKAESGDDKPDAATGDKGDNLAETGGNSATPYIAGGAAVLLAGGGFLVTRRKKSHG